MKLCKDCKHFTEDRRCDGAPDTIIDHIDGGPPKVVNNWRRNPELQREDGLIASIFMGTCGKRGRFFQQNTQMRGGESAPATPTNQL